MGGGGLGEVGGGGSGQGEGGGRKRNTDLNQYSYCTIMSIEWLIAWC